MEFKNKSIFRLAQRNIHWRIKIFSRFEQTGPRSEACHEGEEKDCIGGISRVSTAVNRLMNERPNPIFLNAGDHYQGTLWYNVHRWNVTATFMNMLPHDVMVKSFYGIIRRKKRDVKKNDFSFFIGDQSAGSIASKN